MVFEVEMETALDPTFDVLVLVDVEAEVDDDVLVDDLPAVSVTFTLLKSSSWPLHFDSMTPVVPFFVMVESALATAVFRSVLVLVTPML